jgi:Spx/MgsR family transcriptional regulator
MTAPATSPASVTVYGIPNCDTVKKARAWLAAQGVAAEFVDFKKAGVPPEALDGWLAELGWDALLNRRGTTWRQLDEALRAQVSDAGSARALMLAHPSVVKRPVVDWGHHRTVGFDPGAWSALAVLSSVSAGRPQSA